MHAVLNLSNSSVHKKLRSVQDCVAIQILSCPQMMATGSFLVLFSKYGSFRTFRGQRQNGLMLPLLPFNLFIYFSPWKKYALKALNSYYFFLIVEICFVQIIESYPLLIYIWLCLYHEAGEKARTSCKCFGVLSLAKTEIFCSNDEELRWLVPYGNLGVLQHFCFPAAHRRGQRWEWGRDYLSNRCIGKVLGEARSTATSSSHSIPGQILFSHWDPAWVPGSLPKLGEVAAAFSFTGVTNSKVEHITQRHTDTRRQRQDLTWLVTHAAPARGCLQQHLHTGLM